MLQQKNTNDILGEDGLLNKAEGFAFRKEQLAMANAISLAIENNTKIIVEAGTGTGKTFAYLVPALLSGKKILISTATKNLQDQLFHRDLPVISALLKSTIKIAHLKGRANYLCLRRLNLYLADGRFKSLQIINDLQTVKSWSTTTKTGDLADLAELSEDSAAIFYCTSNADNCLNQECPHSEECFLAKARRKAAQADLLVINHHLFFADQLLKDKGFGELLPNFAVIIFDEAHRLADIATDFFGNSFSSQQVLILIRDVETEIINQALDVKEIVQKAKELADNIAKMRLAFGVENSKKSWGDVVNNADLQQNILSVKSELDIFQEQLKTVAMRSKGLERCWQRVLELITLFNLVTKDSPKDYVHWYETTQKSFRIHLTPINIADSFQRVLAADNAWVFTSATITVDGDFKHFQNELGLNTAETLALKSPFNYQKQAILYIPRGLPDPRMENYAQALGRNVAPIINICRGRTFFLFTSYKMLYQVADLLPIYLDYPLLIQNTKPKKALLAEFRELDNAVLLATSSFWEGVDIKGEALSCVIIDKLPFAVPSDPVVKARIRALEAKNLDPFSLLQLPQAIIALKQGIGRLIRDSNDRGILMICDARIITKNYGKLFLNSLPDMTVTRELAVVEDFYANISN